MQDDPIKQPHCYPAVMRRLHHIRNALARGQFREASKHLGDAVADVQNEIEWCLGSDPILPAMRGFLFQLGDNIGKLEQAPDSLRKEGLAAILKELDEIPREQDQIMADAASHGAPDLNPDYLEREYRARKYGKDGR